MELEPEEQSASFNTAFSEDAVPVCPQCLEPCDPQSYYCPHCGGNAAINPLASYIAFVNIRFNMGMLSKIWNRCWHDSTVALWKKLFYLFLLALGAPVIFVGLPYLGIEKIPDEKKRARWAKAYTGFLIFSLAAGILGILIFIYLEVQSR